MKHSVLGVAVVLLGPVFMTASASALPLAAPSHVSAGVEKSGSEVEPVHYRRYRHYRPYRYSHYRPFRYRYRYAYPVVPYPYVYGYPYAYGYPYYGYGYGPSFHFGFSVR